MGLPVGRFLWIVVLYHITNHATCQTTETPDCETKVLAIISTWQSSTLNSEPWLERKAQQEGYTPFAASNAADGDLTTNPALGRCAETTPEVSPWWQAKLDRSYYVISFSFLSPKVPDLLPRSISIEIGHTRADYGDPVWPEEWQATRRHCITHMEDFSTGSSTFSNCSQPLLGNVVRLTKVTVDAEIMALCEVVVEGIEASCISTSTMLTMTQTSSFVSTFEAPSMSSLQSSYTTAIELSQTASVEQLQTTDDPPLISHTEQMTFAFTAVPTLNEANAEVIGPSISYVYTENSIWNGDTTLATTAMSSWNAEISMSDTQKIFRQATTSLASIVSTKSISQSSEFSTSSLITSTSFIEPISISASVSPSSMISLTTVFLTSPVISPTSQSELSDAPVSTSSTEVSRLSEISTPSFPTISVTSRITIQMCPCACSKSSLIANLSQNNKSEGQVAQEIEQSIAEMTVDAKETSSSHRKLVSAHDDRKSVTLVGTFGVIFVAIVFGSIVISDIPVLYGVVKSIVAHIKQRALKKTGTLKSGVSSLEVDAGSSNVTSLSDV